MPCSLSRLRYMLETDPSLFCKFTQNMLLTISSNRVSDSPRGGGGGGDPMY